jgi:tripartite-type tricarboxylate transporter receptor subunit TctC
MPTLALAFLVLALLAPGPALAQETFPNRPITIVNPFPPGGQADLAGRPLAAAMEKVLKQPVVLTNKAGAAGAVGMQSAAVAKPDGYTIVITVPAISTLPEVDKRQPYFPDVPTLKELGYDVEYYLWIGLFAPKATPAPVMKSLRDAVKQAVEDPAFKSALEKIQSPLAYQDADDFKTWWDADSTRLAEVIKKIGKVEVK